MDFYFYEGNIVFNDFYFKDISTKSYFLLGGFLCVCAWEKENVGLGGWRKFVIRIQQPLSLILTNTILYIYFIFRVGLKIIIFLLWDSLFINEWRMRLIYRVVLWVVYLSCLILMLFGQLNRRERYLNLNLILSVRTQKCWDWLGVLDIYLSLTNGMCIRTSNHGLFLSLEYGLEPYNFV